MQSPKLRSSVRVAAPSLRVVASAALLAAFSAHVAAQVQQGPSSSRSPYLRPSAPNADVVRGVTSIVTATDLVPLTGAPASPYEIGGILDGLGAYDNGDGTVTVVANHELGNTSGVARRHGATGSFVSEMIVDKTTLQLVSAQDLIHTFVLNGVDRNGANANALAMTRFCSSDLAAPTAFYNAASGLGTQDRIYMHGEEGGATGWACATAATGAEKGRAYILNRFNLATTPGVTSTAVGGWENLIASPFAQDLTIVAGNNDGGTGVMNNTVNIYVGTKQATGNVVERAGLENGVNYIVSVLGNPVEIVNATTRATNITTGTRFSLVSFTAPSPSGTTFSRPEDGAWDPTNPRDFYFVTTDRLDTLTNTGFNQTIGASGASQQGKSRLWRLRFDDITNPTLGGEIHLLIDGGKDNQKVNMLDNMCVGGDGMVYLTEDPGNSTYLGKTWAYDPITDTLVQLLKFDTARWGDLAVNGGTPGGIAPYTNDKEISGVIDVSGLFPHAADERVLLLDVQDHSTNAAVATPASVEGGQLLLVRVALRAAASSFGTGCSVTLAPALSETPVIGTPFVTDLTNVAPSSTMLMMLGFPLAVPFDLSILNLPGCLLYQDIVFGGSFPCVPTGPTTAQNTFTFPDAFDLTGFALVMQAWGFDAVAFQTSNALNVRLGL